MAIAKKRSVASRLATLVLHNFWLKLICLVFAFGFYGFIHSARNAQRTLTVPVIADMPASGATPRRQLVTQIPETVTVTIIGPRQQIDSLRSEDLDPIQLNLTGAQNIPEQHFDASQVTGLPPGVRVGKIIPSVIEIRWENVVSRDIKVQGAWTGDPDPATQFERLTIEPDSITATGPESAILSLQFARAEAFDITGLSVGAVTRSLRLDRPRESVSYSRDAVDVTVKLKRRMKSREFDAKVDVLGLPLATTRPANVQVRVFGPPEKVDALQQDAVVPTVNPTDHPTELDLTKPGSAELKVKLVIPEVEVVMAPEKVLVKW